MAASQPGAVVRWRLELAWDGRAYIGWQRQPELQGRSLQQTVEEALARVLAGEQVRVEASGRTDAGVHARCQVAAFDTTRERTAEGIVGGLNHYLPRDIACLDACPAPAAFDPRRWSRGKRYRYRLLVRRERCPFRGGRILHLPRAPDIAAMQAAAPALVGRHDWSSFRARGCSARTTERNLTAVEVVAADDDEVWIDVVGNGFLRHQVRIMAGTLVEVGMGRLDGSELPGILAARDRDAAGPTLPAEGLWLMSVDCPLEPRPA